MNIEGPEGVLEARYDPPSVDARAQAVLCHPHPLYGGSLHDAVLDCLTSVLVDGGVGVLRFNFRGVGGSAGQHDGGPGEVADLRAAAAWLRREHPGQGLWVGGYSFGAWVAWQALAAGERAQRLLLVAPPVGTMSFGAEPPDCAVDVVAGEDDAFIDWHVLEAWSGVIVHPLPGADHFFSGNMAALEDAFRRIVTAQ